jgi:hypothetical protein
MNSLQPELQVLGAQLLAHAAKRAKLKTSEKLSKQMPKGLVGKLRSLAEEGPMKAAKAAVLTLAAISDSGAVEKVSSRYTNLHAYDWWLGPGCKMFLSLSTLMNIKRAGRWT